MSRLTLCFLALLVSLSGLCACRSPEETTAGAAKGEPPKKIGAESEAASSDGEPGLTGKQAQMQSRAKNIVGNLQFQTEQGTADFSIAALLDHAKLEVIDSEDHYYKKRKSYFAAPLVQIMAHLEEAHPPATSEVRYRFVARDGYAVELPRQQVVHPSAYLAFGDAELRDFAPIGEKGDDAGPLYMVWEGEKYKDEQAYPRPWGLVKIVRLSSDAAPKHIQPEGGFENDKLAERGFELFSGDCLRCHSINQEGGKLGPELNVPQNILEYRPEQQVRDFIKNPRQFRYSAMPPHPNLTEKDLDALVAYLRVMGEHKFDPAKAPAP